MKMTLFKWISLTRGLRKRGKGIRESGAFLIGKDGSNKISNIIYYDEIDPNAFSTGIIVLDGLYYAKLDMILKINKSVVIADIHTHPIGCSTKQSDSDKMHPMCRIKGHIAFIAPNYASKLFLKPQNCSSYLYEGNFNWKNLEKNNFPLKLTLI